jgi:probable rRNA maturation factor
MNDGCAQGDDWMTVTNAARYRLPSRFKTVLLEVARRLGFISSRSEVAVRIVEDAEMRRLNRRWKNRNRTTDVLAFSSTGDVVVSADRARVQARELGHSFRAELLLLAIHGLQHLAGRRDETSAARATMLAEGERLLGEAAGEAAGPPFAMMEGPRPRGPRWRISSSSRPAGRR